MDAGSQCGNFLDNLFRACPADRLSGSKRPGPLGWESGRVGWEPELAVKPDRARSFDGNSFYFILHIPSHLFKQRFLRLTLIIPITPDPGMQPVSGFALFKDMYTAFRYLI